MSTSPGGGRQREAAAPPPTAWAMSMAARKSGRATASAGASKTTAKAMPRQQSRMHLERGGGGRDVVGVQGRDEQPRAEHGGKSVNGESAIAAIPATMATTKVSPTADATSAGAPAGVAAGSSWSDEEVGEGGADNG